MNQSQTLRPWIWEFQPQILPPSDTLWCDIDCGYFSLRKIAGASIRAFFLHVRKIANKDR
jgi:hypothetical protein